MRFESEERRDPNLITHHCSAAEFRLWLPENVREDFTGLMSKEGKEIEWNSLRGIAHDVFQNIIIMTAHGGYDRDDKINLLAVCDELSEKLVQENADEATLASFRDKDREESEYYLITHESPLGKFDLEFSRHTASRHGDEWNGLKDKIHAAYYAVMILIHGSSKNLDSILQLANLNSFTDELLNMALPYKLTRQTMNEALSDTLTAKEETVAVSSGASD